MANKIFRQVLCSDRLPKVANKHYLTISQRGYETARFFDGKQFKTSYHDGEIIYWFEEVPINTIKADAWDEGFNTAFDYCKVAEDYNLNEEFGIGNKNQFPTKPTNPYK